jgi:nucleotide-binding universal stress UspA family protein
MPRMIKLFEKILVPYDFSPSAEEALRVATLLAARAHGKIVVLHVVPPIYPLHGRALRPPLKDIRACARELADIAARAARSRQIPAMRTRVVVGHPVASIVAAAGAADSIVMGKRGHSRLARLLLGSVAEAVVRIAPVPVLTIPLPGPAGRTGK